MGRLNANNSRKEIQKTTYLVVCEGKNKTEYNYFCHFRNRVINLKIEKSEATDPKSMIKTAKHYIKKYDMNFADGDKAFCLIDVDLDSSRANLINDLQTKNPNIKIITSNPCFETWFLFHFEEHPKSQTSSQNTKDELKNQHIKNYTESMDVYAKVPEIKQNLQLALARAKQKRKLLAKNYDLTSAEAMHCTFVDELVELVLGKNNLEQ
ncbi:MAG: RloB domain-containing protein [Clostridia bacterium]|nr:RloB domain-containing protein [Clostridia bacterium]